MSIRRVRSSSFNVTKSSSSCSVSCSVEENTPGSAELCSAPTDIANERGTSGRDNDYRHSSQSSQSSRTTTAFTIRSRTCRFSRRAKLWVSRPPSVIRRP